jgi:hypothetical protein
MMYVSTDNFQRGESRLHQNKKVLGRIDAQTLIAEERK